MHIILLYTDSMRESSQINLQCTKNKDAFHNAADYMQHGRKKNFRLLLKEAVVFSNHFKFLWYSNVVLKAPCC